MRDSHATLKGCSYGNNPSTPLPRITKPTYHRIRTLGFRTTQCGCRLPLKGNHPP